MKIPRNYENLGKYLKPNKVLVIFGPRQVGKTTLLKKYLKTCDAAGKIKYRLESGENIRIQELLGSNDLTKLKEFAKGYQLIAIDEAQKIPNVGLALKIMVDQIPGIKIIATGSSSFELAGQVGEPLTGRKITLTLYPVAQLELRQLFNEYDLSGRLEEWLVYGGYPEVVAINNFDEKKRMLTEIVDSYLLKDVLELEKIKGSKKLLDLLRLLAFQVGNEVSLTELGRQLSLDYKTVARYLDLFEKSFIIYNLRGFSRNLRKEITKKSKYYFWDNGVRNAVIANFNSLELRNDIGALWENFMVVERLKKQSYRRIYANNYFWRTWDQKEVDWVEEREGKLFGYEFKWQNKAARAPREWLSVYSEAEFKVIDQTNYLDFIG